MPAAASRPLVKGPSAWIGAELARHPEVVKAYLGEEMDLA